MLRYNGRAWGEDYMSGKLVDYEYPDEAVKEPLARLPVI